MFKKSRVNVSPTILAVTNDWFVFDCTDLEIAESSLSTSLKTPVKTMVESLASSSTTISDKALDTVGASSTAVTVILTSAVSLNPLLSVTLNEKLSEPK